MFLKNVVTLQRKYKISDNWLQTSIFFIICIIETFY